MIERCSPGWMNASAGIPGTNVTEHHLFLLWLHTSILSRKIELAPNIGLDQNRRRRLFAGIQLPKLRTTFLLAWVTAAAWPMQTGIAASPNDEVAASVRRLSVTDASVPFAIPADLFVVRRDEKETSVVMKRVLLRLSYPNLETAWQYDAALGGLNLLSLSDSIGIFLARTAHPMPDPLRNDVYVAVDRPSLDEEANLETYRYRNEADITPIAHEVFFRRIGSPLLIFCSWNVEYPSSGSCQMSFDWKGVRWILDVPRRFLIGNVVPLEARLKGLFSTFFTE